MADGDPDPSDLGDLDPLLADLMETVTAQLEAGETIDVEALVREHPERAEDIQHLIQAVRGLAVIGRTVGTDGAAPLPAEQGDVGQRMFGDFRIVGEIGRGGMGIVYEARQIAISRRVALKVLPLAAAADPRAIQRFQLEAQVAGLLEHPHIVPVYSVGIVADVPYYAMQFIEGGSLADLIGELRGLVDRGAPPADDRSTSGSGSSALARGLLNGQFAAARTNLTVRLVAAPTTPAPCSPPKITPQSAAAPIFKQSSAWAFRPPTPWPMPTTRGSFIAMSSRRTYCSTAAAIFGWPTLAWPTYRETPV